jgi:hypothetical protein
LLGSPESSAATAIIKQQQAQLDRLLSRRDSAGVHESVWRAVPAVAVRRSSSSSELKRVPVFTIEMVRRNAKLGSFAEMRSLDFLEVDATDWRG